MIESSGKSNNCSLYEVDYCQVHLAESESNGFREVFKETLLWSTGRANKGRIKALVSTWHLARGGTV